MLWRITPFPMEQRVLKNVGHLICLFSRIILIIWQMSMYEMSILSNCVPNLAFHVFSRTRGNICAWAGEPPHLCKFKISCWSWQINSTENRSVLHVALRAPRDAVICSDGRNVVPDVWGVLDKIKEFSERLRNGSWVIYCSQFWFYMYFHALWLSPFK